MNSIDQKVVEMKFDNSQFESAVSQTMSTLDKFKDKLNFKNTDKGLDKLSKSTSNYQYTLQDIGESVSNLERRFSVMGTIGARIFENLTDSAMGFVSRGIGNIVSSITQGGMSRAMNLEQARFQMEGLLSNAEEVHRVIYDDILPELQGTPFSLDQAAVVIGQLVASGKQSSEQIKRATRGMAGLAAMTGHSFEDVGRIFTKVAGNGVMMAEELNQLSGYGVNAAADLAKFYKGVEDGSYKATKQTLKDMEAIKKQFGEFNEGTIREAASKRLIHYGSMAAAMDELYGAHAQKSTQMYTGALEDLKAAFARIGAEPAAIRLGVLRDAFNALVPAVDAVNAVLKPLWNSARSTDKAFEKVPEYVKPFTGPIAQQIQKTGWAFQKLFVQLDDNNEIVRVTKDSYKKLGFEMKKLKNGSYEFYETLADGSKKAYDDKQALMNPHMLKILTSSTKAVVNVFSALGKVVRAVATGVSKAFPKITLENIAELAERVEKFTEKLNLSEITLSRLQWFSRGFFTPVSLAIRGLISTIGFLVNVFKTLSKVMSPIMTVFSAFLGMIGRIAAGLGNAITTIASAITGFGKKSTEGIRNASIWGELLQKLTTFCTNLASRFDEIGIKAYKFLSNLSEMKAIQLVAGGIQIAIEKIHGAFSKVSEVVTNFLDKLKPGEKLKEYIDKIKEFLETKADDASSSLGKLLGWLGKFSFYKNVVEGLSGSFSGLLSTLAGFEKYKPLKGLRKWFADLGAILVDIMKSFADGDFFIDRAKEVFGWFAKYKKIGGQLKNGFVPAMQGLLGLVPSLFKFKDWGEIFDNLGDKISSAGAFILKTLGLFGTGVAEDAAKGMKKLSTTTDSLKATAKGLGNNDYIKPLTMMFEKLRDAANGWLKDMDPSKAKKLILSLAYFGTCLYYLSTIKEAARAFRGLTKVAEVIAKGFEALGSIAQSISGIFKAVRGAVAALKMVAYMHAFAVALIGMAAAMLIISRIDPDRLKYSAMVMAGCVAGLSVIFGLVTAMAHFIGPEVSKTLLFLAATIGALGLAMLAVASSIYMLSELKEDQLTGPVNAIANIMLEFGVIMAALSFMPNMKANISTAAWALVGIAAGCKSMAAAIVELGSIPKPQLEQGVALARKLMDAMGVFALLAGWGKHTFSAGMSMIAVALALKSLTGIVKDLAGMGKNYPKAMKAAQLMKDLLTNLGFLMLSIGGMTTLANRFGKGLGPALAIIATVVAGIWVIGQTIMQLATLTPAQIDMATEALYGLVALMALVSLISMMGGKNVAMGAGAMAALAVGMFLLSEGIIALGNTSHFLAGVVKMIIVLAGLIGAVMTITAIMNKFMHSFLDLKVTAGIALIAGGMFLFAVAIKMVAELPIENLTIAIIGLVGALAIAGGILAIFATLSPGLALVAAAFALLGVGALFVGAGIFLLTLALSALIPLLTGLAGVDTVALQKGLDVLAQAATGLTKVMDILAGGLVKLGGALIVVGVGLIVVGVGAIVLGAGMIVAAAGVFLLAGSFIVLYEVLSTFFPSLVEPATSAMQAIIDGFTNSFANMTGPLEDNMQQSKDSLNGMLQQANAEGDETSKEGATTIADNYNEIWPMVNGDAEVGIDQFAELTGLSPVKAGEAWSSNESSLLDPIKGTVGNMDGLQLDMIDGWKDTGEKIPKEEASGIKKNSGKPASALELMFPKLAKVHKKMENASKKAGEAQAVKMGSGIDHKKGEVSAKVKAVMNKANEEAKRGQQQFKNAGENMGHSLGAGIRSKLDWVAGKAKEIAHAAIEAAKSALKINSPSKVFISIGQSVDEGFAKGILKDGKLVQHASEDMAAMSIDAVSSALMANAAFFDSSLDFTPTITPVVDLTNVDQSVGAIGDKFGQAFSLSSPYASMNAAFAAASFNAANQNDKFKSIDRLAKRIDTMTETMNSRSLNVYNTIEGSADPDAFAEGLVRSFRLNARTV